MPAVQPVAFQPDVQTVVQPKVQETFAIQILSQLVGKFCRQLCSLSSRIAVVVLACSYDCEMSAAKGGDAPPRDVGQEQRWWKRRSHSVSDFLCCKGREEVCAVIILGILWCCAAVQAKEENTTNACFYPRHRFFGVSGFTTMMSRTILFLRIVL